MGNAEVRRLPITDAEGRPLGIISLADVARNAGILGLRNAEHLAFSCSGRSRSAAPSSPQARARPRSSARRRPEDHGLSPRFGYWPRRFSLNGPPGGQERLLLEQDVGHDARFPESA